MPHIFAPLDEQVAYGLAWASAEDNFKEIQENILPVRGRMAEYSGKDGAIMDVFGHLMNLNVLVDEAYDTSFSEKFKNTKFSGYKWNKGKLISVTTLAILIKEFGLPKFCKIDVEGFEYQVLQGMPLGSPIPYLLVEDGSQEETKKYSEYLFFLGYMLVGRQRNNNFFKIRN